MVLVDLSLTEINLIQTIVTERCRVTEYMLQFCGEEWAYKDKNAHAPSMIEAWHRLNALYGTLEDSKRVHKIATDLADLDQFVFDSIPTEPVASPQPRTHNNLFYLNKTNHVDRALGQGRATAPKKD